MMEKKRSLTFFLILLFIVGTLPITNPVSADGEVDNWPENDAWLRIELISWSANDSVEWDNGGGLPDPIFKICVEADGDNLDCINTPTWENQLTLNTSWNYSMDIPDNSNILNITIECEDNDAFNDDECDMNSDVNYWRLYAEYNWSATPSLTISGDGDDDDDVTWKNAASTWKLSIDGYGDEDGDGITDNIDLCPETLEGETLIDNNNLTGCAYSDLDSDLDGYDNFNDFYPYNFFQGSPSSNAVDSIDDFVNVEWKEYMLEGNNTRYFIKNLNLLSYENETYFTLNWGIVNTNTGEHTPYSEILCDDHNAIPSDAGCEEERKTSLVHGPIYAFDFNNDGYMDIIAGGEVYKYSHGEFWRSIKTWDENNCSGAHGVKSCGWIWIMMVPLIRIV